MAQHRKISVSVPDSLYFAVNAELQRTGRSRSAIVSDALRERFEPELERGHHEFTLDAPSKEEVEELRRKVERLERLAEESGAV